MAQLRDQKRRTPDEVSLLKNAIVRNVSHELKTPLLQVKSAVALLAEDRNIAANKLIGYARDATTRLETVIKNITQLADSLEPTLGPVLVRECIDYAILNLRRSWEHKEAITRVHVTIESNLPPGWGDKQGLSTVMQLLIDNALKFAPMGSTVTIRTSPNSDKPGYSRTDVIDGGPGVPEEYKIRLFDRVVQVEGRSGKRRGSGLGLAFCRLVAEGHGGRIWIEDNPGGGSIFSLTLPMVGEGATVSKQVKIPNV